MEAKLKLLMKGKITIVWVLRRWKVNREKRISTADIIEEKKVKDSDKLIYR